MYPPKYPNPPEKKIYRTSIEIPQKYIEINDVRLHFPSQVET